VVSRRQFLLGAGAVVVAGGGAAGGVLATNESLRHELGLANSPDRHFPDHHVPSVEGTLDSRYMGGPVAWRISQPSTPPRAIVFCLHGRTGSHATAFDAVHLDDATAELNLPLAIAGVDGGDHSYWHPRADGTDPMAMLLHEFIPLAHERLPSATRSALLGWSMGGFGALLAAEAAPHRFAAVVGSSPALFTSYADSAEGAFDGAGDFEAHDVFARIDRLARVPVRVDCGRSDPFYDRVRQFASEAPGGVTSSFGKGFHDIAYWRSVAAPELTFIANAVR
jgi:enterochelin esterase-like enzyme